MPLCRFPGGGAMFCATPVENMFLEEYMPNAPSDYVKVYLYGLMHCYYPNGGAADLSSFARSLRIPEDDVRRAFFYWQQQGLVRIQVSPQGPCVFYNILPRDARGFALPAADRFLNFNRKVQSLFDPRQLTPRETDAMHEWIEADGFEEDSILQLCEYAISLHGRNVGFAYLKTVAQNWLAEGLTSAADVRAHLQQRKSEVRDAQSILASLGIRNRAATEAELALYRKWTLEWGFDRDAIDVACAQSASAAQPTMKYVDTILSSFAENHVFTAPEIEAFLQYRAHRRAAAASIQNAMGVYGAPSPTLMNCLDTWRTQYGYDTPVVLLAAQQAGRRGQKTLDALENILSSWHAANLLSQQDVVDYLAAQKTGSEAAANVLRHLALEFAPNEQTRRSVSLWNTQWGLPMDVILYGADEIVKSGVQRDRMRALHNLLQAWFERGVRDLAAAQAAQAAAPAERSFTPYSAARGQQSGNNNSALSYEQRTDSMNDAYLDL